MQADSAAVTAKRVNDDFNDKDLVFGRTVVPVPNRNKAPKKGKLGFEYAEHCFIGDAITLTLADGSKVAASDHKFQLKQSLSLTYGQINGLSGDFYGTAQPISDGADEQDRSARFIAAYNTLADGGSRQPKEATDILTLLQGEVDAVNTALENHQDPSVVYSKLPDISAKLQLITIGRSGPGYLGLARINWDHFGADARTAYNTGHAIALQQAASGDLEGAYALNAFADHFLEDSFSAGHLRTPRRLLHHGADLTADLCAKFMHDEDCAIGLSVQNPAGESWFLYGDKRALDEEDEDNKKHCVDAVQASADEIYAAYQTKHIPSIGNYAAWTIAPTLYSARAQQELSTLFTFQNTRRSIIENRRMWEFKPDWWYWSTALECKTSHLWNYPITINGARKIVPYTAIAVTTPRTYATRLYYQKPDGGIIESEHADGLWSGGPNADSIVKAVLFTPLATVSWDEGREVRVYYLNENYILQEYCSSTGGEFWFPGDLDGLKIQAATNTSIAAVSWNDGSVRVRLYLQEEGSNAIREICQGRGVWTRGRALPNALSGSSLSAVYFYSGGSQLRVYYQDEDLYLREYCWRNSSWVAGQFNPGQAPGCTPICALGWVVGNGVEMQAYWRSLQDEIVGMSSKGSWHSVPTAVGAPLKAGTLFTAAQWNSGQYVRIYYQVPDDSVLEMCRDDGGYWYQGSYTASSQ